MTTLFISYGHEGAAHVEWVESFARRLRNYGFVVVLDRWAGVAGVPLPQFMETSIRESDFVLVICTPTYKTKSDQRSGGVGYEGNVMTGEILVDRKVRKFVPLLRAGSWAEAAPSWLRGNLYFDLRGDDLGRSQYQQLIEVLERREGASAAPPRPAPERDLLSGYPNEPQGWQGRERELATLERIWSEGRIRIVAITGVGGEGKTALARRFVDSLRKQDHNGAKPVLLWWSLYQSASVSALLRQVGHHLGFDMSAGDPALEDLVATQLATAMVDGIGARPVVLVLDGFEVVQEQGARGEGHIRSQALRKLLLDVLNDNQPRSPNAGLILVTTRQRLAGLPAEDPGYEALAVGRLSNAEGAALIEARGVQCDPDELSRFVEEIGAHCLTLTIAGALLADSGSVRTSLAELREIVRLEASAVTDPDLTGQIEHPHRVTEYLLRHCQTRLGAAPRCFMQLLSCFLRPAGQQDIEHIVLPAARRLRIEALDGLSYSAIKTDVVARLRRLGLLEGDEQRGFDAHPLVRLFFYEEEQSSGYTATQIHGAFCDELMASLPQFASSESVQTFVDVIAQGVRAGRADTMMTAVYFNRVHRGNNYLSGHQGAREANLSMLTQFFPDGDLSREPLVTRPDAIPFLLNNAAMDMRNAGRLNQAAFLFECAAEARRRLGDPHGVSVNERNLWQVRFMAGDFAAAGNALRESLRAAMPSSNVNDQSISLAYLGVHASVTGDDEEAERHFHAAMDLTGQLTSVPGAWYAIWLARRGRPDEAMHQGFVIEEAWDYRADKTPVDLVFMRTALAYVWRRICRAPAPSRSDPWQVFDTFQRLVLIARTLHYEWYLAFALLEAARLALAIRSGVGYDRFGYLRRAEEYLAEAAKLADEGSYGPIAADVWIARAELSEAECDVAKMRESVERAHTVMAERAQGYAWVTADAEAAMRRSRGLELYNAANTERWSEMNALLQTDVDVDYWDRGPFPNTGLTPLHWAAFYGQESLVQELIARGAGLEFSDVQGRRPLVCAATTGSVAAVKVLLEQGASLEALEYAGWTLIPPSRRSAEVVSVLRAHGYVG